MQFFLVITPNIIGWHVPTSYTYSRHLPEPSIIQITSLINPNLWLSKLPKGVVHITYPPIHYFIYPNYGLIEVTKGVWIIKDLYAVSTEESQTKSITLE